jgi:hypothetical protein
MVNFNFRDKYTQQTHGRRRVRSLKEHVTPSYQAFCTGLVEEDTAVDFGGCRKGDTGK